MGIIASICFLWAIYAGWAGLPDWHVYAAGAVAVLPVAIFGGITEGFHSNGSIFAWFGATIVTFSLTTIGMLAANLLAFFAHRWLA